MQRLIAIVLLSIFSLGTWACAEHESGAGAAAQNLSRDGRYPAHWWAEVPRDASVPEWEILPQEAAEGEVILSKRNELGILSNFAPTPFTYRGKTYASVEGFWQGMKFPENADDPRAKFPGLEWPYTRAEVEAMTAFDAKHAGDVGSANMKKMGIDWVSFAGEHFPYKTLTRGRHYALVVEAMRAKLDQNAEVKRILRQTGDLVLRPDHKAEGAEPDEWKYYQLWTQFRAELASPAGSGR